jgi:hypothetical protein
MKLKALKFADIAAIQEAETDELNKVEKKRNFRQLFKNCATAQKPVYMAMERVLNFKKITYLPHEFSICKIIRPKTFGPHSV